MKPFKEIKEAAFFRHLKAGTKVALLGGDVSSTEKSTSDFEGRFFRSKFTEWGVVIKTYNEDGVYEAELVSPRNYPLTESIDNSRMNNGILKYYANEDGDLIRLQIYAEQNALVFSYNFFHAYSYDEIRRCEY